MREIVWEAGGYPETPVIPDEPDAPDAGDAPQDLVMDGLATGSSSASGWLLLSLSGYLITRAVVIRQFSRRYVNHGKKKLS